MILFFLVSGTGEVNNCVDGQTDHCTMHFKLCFSLKVFQLNKKCRIVKKQIMFCD